MYNKFFCSGPEKSLAVWNKIIMKMIMIKKY